MVDKMETIDVNLFKWVCEYYHTDNHTLRVEIPPSLP